MSLLSKAPPPLERRAALERIHAALCCDLALSEGQLLRRWGVVPSREEAQELGLHVVQVVLNRSHHANRLFRVRFFTPYLRVARLGAPLLRHLAGVGEMRHILDVSPTEWCTDTHRVHYREHPDAYWYSPGGPIAIEYDAGSYPTELLWRKVQTFARRFVGQRWGAPTERRVKGLQAKLRSFGLEERFVIRAQWW